MAVPEYGKVPQTVDGGSPKALVLSADKFEDLELYVPVFRLVEAGWAVDIAAPEEGRITGESSWYYVVANKRISDVVPEDYDLLVVPGGKPDGAPTTVRNNARAVEIARSFLPPTNRSPLSAMVRISWFPRISSRGGGSPPIGATGCRRRSPAPAGRGKMPRWWSMEISSPRDGRWTWRRSHGK